MILAFLGFCVSHRGVALEAVGLREYRNSNSVANFMSFLIAREVGRNYAGNHIQLAIKVAKFLVSAAPASSPHRYEARASGWGRFAIGQARAQEIMCEASDSLVHVSEAGISQLGRHGLRRYCAKPVIR